jgi:hypothetical protein
MERDTHREARVSLRRIAVAAVAVAALLLPAAIGADPGFVPGNHGVAGEVLSNHQHKDAGQAGSAGNLTYHGGPVIQSNTTRLIFWGSFSTDYINTITKYFQDVAADSQTHSNTNVYSTDPQYTDGSGPAAYDSTFGGAWNDTTTAVPNHCSSEYAGTNATISGCVLDTDIQNEVLNAMSQPTNVGWTAGLNNIYFVFTPQNVGSCVDSTSKDCAFTDYCAYHWYFTPGGGTPVVYANQPYTDTSGVGTLYAHACDSGQQPNNNWADSTINVASHEHNEAVTDPEGNAWYDSQGYEDGDKCAWNFGTALGGAQGSQWNQVINGDHYYLQQEWDNATSGCVLNTTPPPPPPPPPTISGFSPAGGGGVGTQVTISGQNLTGATAVKFGGTSATSFSVGSDTQITAVVPSGARTGYVTVTTANGTATSPTQFQVLAPDFSITFSNATVRRGSSTNVVITITATNNVPGSVSLTVTGLPNGATARFNPGTVTTSTTGGITSTLTVSTRSNTRTGGYQLTVTGTNGTLKRTGSATLTVTN